jgi:hypothetical protein
VKLLVVRGDLLDQDVDVLLNAWNRNFIPWALWSRPQPVACRSARSFTWQASTPSGERRRRRSAPRFATPCCWPESVGSTRSRFPCWARERGGRREDDVLKLMRDELAGLEFEGEVRLVLFSRD